MSCLCVRPGRRALIHWAGAPALLTRLFAPAFQPGYYDIALPYSGSGWGVPGTGVQYAFRGRGRVGWELRHRLLSDEPGQCRERPGFLPPAGPSVTRPPPVGSPGAAIGRLRRGGRAGAVRRIRSPSAPHLGGRPYPPWRLPPRWRPSCGASAPEMDLSVQ